MAVTHLVRRFAGSLWPAGPRRRDTAWVETVLTPAEQALWRRLSRADRRHAAGVARRVEATLAPGSGPTRPVLAAALLHDVGKLDARLGTGGRVVATVLIGAAGRERVDRWVAADGFRRRVGLYLRHPRLGAERLALAGSDPLTVAWAAEHHRPPEDWTVPAAVGAVLKAADDD